LKRSDDEHPRRCNLHGPQARLVAVQVGIYFSVLMTLPPVIVMVVIMVKIGMIVVCMPGLVVSMLMFVIVIAALFAHDTSCSKRFLLEGRVLLLILPCINATFVYKDAPESCLLFPGRCMELDSLYDICYHVAYETETSLSVPTDGHSLDRGAGRQSQVFCHG